MKSYYKESDAKEMFYDFIDNYKGDAEFHGVNYSYTTLMAALEPVKIERAFNIWVIKLKEEQLLNTQAATDPAKKHIWNPTKDSLSILRQCEALAKEVIDGDLS